MDWAETPATMARAFAEEPVLFSGPDGPLRGIFTPPAPEAPCAGHCLVLPGHPRFGNQRLAVIAARVLAAEGFAALRFDFHGHGESGGTSTGADRNQPGARDVDAAIRFLCEERAQSRFLLAGYCFDGLSALAGIPASSTATRGGLFASPPVLQRTSAGGEPPLTANRPRWALRLRRWWRHPLEFSMAARADHVRHPSPTDSPNADRCVKIAKVVEDAIAALISSGAPALFIYGENDSLYAEFKIAERQLLAALNGDPRRLLQVEVWPGSVQSFESAPALLERTIRWAREFHPARGSHQL